MLVASSHGRGVAAAIEAATGKPCFGWIPRDATLAIPERRLGLIPTGEAGDWQAFIEAARRLVEKHIDIDAIFPHPLPSAKRPPDRKVSVDGQVVIAVARDEAFSFIYPENLELLEEAGARLVFFSPLWDAALPKGASGIILSGRIPRSVCGAVKRE